MILLIDNYDSFTFNLAQYLGELGAPPMVRRNDEITIDEIDTLKPTHIVISPGPGRPEDAGDLGRSDSPLRRRRRRCSASASAIRASASPSAAP